MNLRRMTRGDGWIVLLIAIFTLCTMLGLGAQASNRLCEEVGHGYGWTVPMCKSNRLD